MCSAASPRSTSNTAAPTRPLLETALAVYHDLGDLRGAAQILNRMGALHLRQGRTEQAKAAYRQVSAASQAIGDRIGEAYGLLGMGETELLAGELDHAAEHLDAALTLADGLGRRSSPPAPGWQAGGSRRNAASASRPCPCWIGRSGVRPDRPAPLARAGARRPACPRRHAVPSPTVLIRTRRAARRERSAPHAWPSPPHQSGSPGAIQ
ncbi:tetratricopeptide repeat protein [Streptosporangium lutulentum]